MPAMKVMKKALKKGRMPVMRVMKKTLAKGRKATGLGNVDATEARLIASMVEHNVPWTKIHAITGRCANTISNFRKIKKDAPNKRGPGRKKSITPSDVKRLIAAMERLQKNADAEKEVTVDMVKAEVGVTASNRVVLNALHKEDIYFYRLKEKPLLEDRDVESRGEWSEVNARRSKTQWVKFPHAIIDNKHFQIYTNKYGRQHAARRGIRGAYQKKGTAPKRHLVKPKASIKFPAKGVVVMAGVIKGRIRMWEYCDGNWNGEKAAAMYKGPLLKAMKRAYPERSSTSHWTVLEDNDPSGYKSRKALTAKSEAHISTLDLPRRSPDLNVLDYSLWSIINRNMRAQERSFKKSKKETATEFKARLRRTALSLPESVVKKAVADMHRRTLEVLKEEGGLIKE
jgi:hypothetical protein